MVFRKVGNHYEVGILDDKTAIDHQFKISIGKSFVPKDKLTQFLNSGKPWNLDVMTASGKKAHDIKPRQNKSCSRLQDTKDAEVDLDHVFDFCWLMDLETEFYDGKKLKMREGRLKPIIKLNNGELYAKYNFDELGRLKGQSDAYSEFGFVADMIALRVDLKDGERLELTAGNEVVFSLKPDEVRNAGIFNAPMGPNMDEPHFRYYYNLFVVPESEQYRIQLWDPMKGHHPLNRYFPGPIRKSSDPDFNPFNDIRDLCFDNQMCGAVFLGKSTDPLR
jgi:hypothetical protein